jgi:hypothetical protein
MLVDTQLAFERAGNILKPADPEDAAQGVVSEPVEPDRPEAPAAVIQSSVPLGVNMDVGSDMFDNLFRDIFAPISFPQFIKHGQGHQQIEQSGPAGENLLQCWPPAEIAVIRAAESQMVTMPEEKA